MSLREGALMIGILAASASSLFPAAAEELLIPGQFGGKGEAVYEKTKFGEGLRASNLHESVSYPGCGNFRTDQGTIEVWLKALDGTEPNQGQAWRNILTAPPLESQFSDFHTQLGLTITEDVENIAPPGCMSFSLMTQKRRNVRSEPLRWQAGSEHYVAATWGRQGMELYIDGRLAARDPQAEKEYLERFPARLIFGNHPDYHLTGKAVIDEIKISDIQRDKSYIEAAFQSSHAPQMDANTLLLSHLDSSLDAAGNVTEWKKAQPAAAIQTAWQCGIDPELVQSNIFLKDEEIALHAFASRFAQSPETFSLECSIRDFRGQEVFSSSQQAALPARCEKLDIPVPLKRHGLRPGFYTAKLKLKGAQGLISESTQSLCLLDKALPPGKMLWGFNNYDDYEVSFAALAKMGVGLLRGHGVYFWPRVEPQKGKFYWDASRSFTDKCSKYGIKILGVLGNTPLWANVPPDNLQEFAGGKNYSKAIALKEGYRPRDIEEWSDYVFQTVSKHPQVRYWEIWNEPDWHLPKTPGFSFGGTTAQYFELMKAAYAAVKKANPECVVVFPGIACAEAADPNFAGELLKLGCMKRFDLLGMHAYGGHQFFKEQLELFRWQGYQGPVWMSEFVPDAFITEPFPTRGRKIALDQSRHIVRTLPFGISAYVIHSPDIYFPHGQPTEACFATAFLFRQLHDLDFLQSPLSGSYVFGNRDRTALVLWGNGPVELRSNASRLILTDHMGFARELETKNGVASFTPGEFLYVEAAGTGKIDPAALRIKQGVPEAMPLNGSFEEYEGDAGFGNFTPLKWELSAEHREGKASIDLNMKRSGKASLLLERPGNPAASGKVAVSQALPPLPKGRSFILKAWIKAEGPPLSQAGVATVSVWDREKRRLYGSLSVTEGKPEFAPCSARVAIPADASDNVIIGCSVGGQMARAWFDDVSLSLAGADPELIKKTVFIDLKPKANQSLGDNTPGNSQSQWNGFGKSNLSRLQAGLRDFGSELFKVEDGDKACVFLGSPQNPALPLQAEGIKVGEKLKTLNFLCTALHVEAKPGESLGDCVVRYSDGSEAAIPFVRGRDVDDWYPPLIGKGVRIAENVKVDDDDVNGERAIFISKWENPQPGKPIESLALRSSGKALLVFLAISGERS